jgi:hypothetical protein
VCVRGKLLTTTRRSRQWTGRGTGEALGKQIAPVALGEIDIRAARPALLDQIAIAALGEGALGTR